MFRGSTLVLKGITFSAAIVTILRIDDVVNSRSGVYV